MLYVGKLADGAAVFWQPTGAEDEARIAVGDDVITRTEPSREPGTRAEQFGRYGACVRTIEEQAGETIGRVQTRRCSANQCDGQAGCQRRAHADAHPLVRTAPGEIEQPGRRRGGQYAQSDPRESPRAASAFRSCRGKDKNCRREINKA